MAISQEQFEVLVETPEFKKFRENVDRMGQELLDYVDKYGEKYDASILCFSNVMNGDKKCCTGVGGAGSIGSVASSVAKGINENERIKKVVLMGLMAESKPVATITINSDDDGEK